jgi:hypothetical protein
MSTHQDHRRRNHRRRDRPRDRPRQSPKDALESVLRTKIEAGLLSRLRTYEFLEARIISERIEHWIEPE